MRAELVPADGSAPIEITKDLIVVGRQEDCDIQLDHKSVSKLHCVIVKTDGLLLLRDLGSTNGTRVNGQRVRRAALLPNDNLAIARYKYRVHLGPDRDAPQTDTTQKLNAAELVQAVSKVEPPPPPARMWPNSLPDVYPGDEAQNQDSN
jgi:pSer/pThr/pTyr-binding forkhead associated (FHA) protein